MPYIRGAFFLSGKNMSADKRLPVLYLLASFLLAIWAYYPSLSGSFTFDDVANVSDNEYLKIESFSPASLWQASLSSHSGPLKRPVAMFSFAVNHVLTGMDPWWMKLTNLLIHLLNALVLLFFCKEFFSAVERKTGISIKAAPYLVTGIWLVHPVNLTAVSYIVQRMTSLSATFVLIALYFYMKLRNSSYQPRRAWILSGLVMFSWALGLFTKEVAALLSVFVFVIEWQLFDFRTDSDTERTHMRILWFLFAVPWLAGLCYVVYKPSFLLAAYEIRDFTLVERVLTETRIVVDYIRLILVPDIQDMGLYHDDIVVSTSFLSPLTTLLSSVLIAALLVSAVLLRKQYVLYSLGVFWFFGGHVLESTVHPLELMFIHRNYLPSVGVFFILVAAFNSVAGKYKNLVIGALICALIAFTLCTRSLSHHWSGDYRMMILEALNHPQSVRANFRAGQVFKLYAIHSSPGAHREQNKKMAIEHFEKIRSIDPRFATGEMSILETYTDMKEPIPEGLLDQLVDILGTTKVEVSMVNIFKSYRDCVSEMDCPLSSRDFERIKDAMLENEEMQKFFRRSILVVYAEYLAEHLGDYDTAITVLLEAIIVHPMLEDFRLLAHYYEKGGYYDRAEDTLQFLEAQDKLGRFRNFALETRTRLLTAKESTSPAIAE